jgi:general secretion pathway protein I
MSARRGFTLLEVMVALAILAMSLMAVADIISGSVANHTYARELAQATLLARGKMVELEQKFEDDGFKDFDETLDGDFEDQGHAEMKWKVEVVKPDVNLGPEQLIGILAGAGGKDSSQQDIMGKLLGKLSGAAPGSPAAGAGGAAGASPFASLITTQLTVFGEMLKKSLREVRFTVAWKEGKQVRQFTVTTHLVVLLPKAQGGVRGDWPDQAPGTIGTAGPVPPAGVLNPLGMPGTAPPGGLPPVIRDFNTKLGMPK